MADYVTAEQVGYLAHEFEALASTGSDLLVTAASRIFDKECEVADDFFQEAAEPAAYTNRNFIGNGTAYLQLDPFTALNPTDPILMNEGTIAVPDYDDVNLPDYITRDGQLIVLDRTVRRNFSVDGINRYVGWPDGKQIRVSANWGFSVIPADVSLACAHIALHLWRTADPAFAVISNADGAASRPVTLPGIARDIIDKYRAKYSRKALFA